MAIRDVQAALDGRTLTGAAEQTSRLPDTVRHRTVLCWAPIGPAIVDAAAHEAADLVVVPMRRAGALGHLLHDGSDWYVLRHCAVPVLVVPVEPERRQEPAGISSHAHSAR